jgi:hypothetical protein
MRLAVALTLFAAFLSVAAVASTGAAQIGFASTSPVSVRGTGFKSGERVALTVAAKVTRKKIVIANSRGAFRATFSAFSIPRCQAYAARAKGNRGSTASVKVIPECAAEGAGISDALMPIDPVAKKP